MRKDENFLSDIARGLKPRKFEANSSIDKFDKLILEED